MTTKTKTKTTTRRRLTQTERADMQREALTRAASGISLGNYPAIVAGFTARGIPADEIRPRENVFTFNAWKALGRYVKRGEKGVQVITFVPTKKRERDPSSGETIERDGSRPTSAYVFHISQTEAMSETPTE